MTGRTVCELAAALRGRYLHPSKVEKGHFLDGSCQITGCHLLRIRASTIAHLLAPLLPAWRAPWLEHDALGICAEEADPHPHLR